MNVRPAEIIVELRAILHEIQSQNRLIYALLEERKENKKVKKFFSTEEIALAVGRNASTVRLWCKKGKLDCIKINNRYSIPYMSVKNFLESAKY